MRKGLRIWVIVAFFIIMGSMGYMNLLAQHMIADITEDVETEFGTYHPYPVDVVPSAGPYVVEQDFSNVSNFDDFESIFSDADKDLLAQNYFVVKPSQFKQIYDVYNFCKELHLPIFVTTDAMLHTFHILYDYALRVLEVQRFANDLDNLNKAILATMNEYYTQATSDSLKQIVLRTVAYVSVATVLKDSTVSVPTYVDSLVQGELELIRAHEGFAESPIFTSPSVKYREDYSQYVPRGHYTRNEILQTYFRSMMWYGRIGLRLQPGESQVEIQKGKEETLMALLLVKALHEVTVEGEPALAVWDRIYQPTIFFVGKSDDLNAYDYDSVVENVYGADITSLSSEELAEDTHLTDFITAAKELRDPYINSSWVWEDEDSEKVTKGFRFMGQHFIPDSYMFQQLVHTKVIDRLMPFGLDVMSVMGSERAFQILDEVYDQTVYPNYVSQMDSLRIEFDGLDDAAWAQNLYWNWLYTLMTFLFPKGEGYPTFMQSQAWADKELNTALGSWAELRHDTILYAKQSYSIFIGPPPPLPPFARGYVEPNPHLFARLASLANLMRIGLGQRGLLLEEFRFKLIDLESLLIALKEIAQKELTNQALTSEECDLIWTIGENIENLLTFSPDVSEQVESDSDGEMPVIADVHTDPNSGSVLEEGVGYPLFIHVIVKNEDQLKITTGSIFSYYEFTHPMSDRLTDEAWQTMLKGDDPPQMEIWTQSFSDRTQSFRNPDPQNHFLQTYDWVIVNMTVNPQSPQVGDLLDVHVAFNAGFESPLRADFYREDKLLASVELLPDETTPEENDFVCTVQTGSWEPGVIMASIFYETWTIHCHWFEITGITATDDTSGDDPLPTRYNVFQNYPNPFNETTTIHYTLPYGERNTENGTWEANHITLKIFNILGQEVRTLIDEFQEVGYYTVTWNGTDNSGRVMASGVYFCRLSVNSGQWSETKKMVLLK